MKKDYDFSVFGDNLKAIRNKNGLSKKEMSKKLGIGTRSLSLIESGIAPPRLSSNILIKINREFGILPSEIFLPLKDKNN